MLGHLHFFAENRPSSIFPSPLPSQCCISGLKVHFLGATLTRGEGGRHFAQTRPSRASKTERLANICHIFRLSQGLLSRIVVRVRRNHTTSHISTRPGRPKHKRKLNPFIPKSDQFQIPLQPHQKYDITQYGEPGFLSLAQMEDDHTAKFSLPRLFISLKRLGERTF